MTATGNLLIVFFLMCVLGAVSGVLLPDRKNPLGLAIIASAASLLLLWIGAGMLFAPKAFVAVLWVVKPFGPLTITVDRLSSLFMVVVGLAYFPVSIFSAGYLKRYENRYSLKSFAVFYHLLFAAIVLTLIAADIISFFIAWEAMSILCYLLVNYEHENETHIRSGYLMLAMGEAGTLAAILALLLIAKASGGITFADMRTVAGSLGPAVGWGVFLLSFLGFGVKAGLVPVSSWLPGAYQSAPGNISALFSGAVTNLGLYGIIRVNADFFPVGSVGPGLIVLGIGTLSALTGILYALPENDMKRMLAHSSIENMGICTAGLGAGLAFSATGHAVLAGLAFIAALYHMVNHSLYKTLLFLGAATVDLQVGDRNMDHLGGLIRKMPWTAFFFLVGALSIAALPPLNGFVSEWLTWQSLLQCSVLSSKAVKIVFALCGAGLALTAALAVTCFVKAFAMNFLGKARSEKAQKASEARRSMTIPMALLAIFCLLLGILPTYVIPVINRVTIPLVQADVIDALVPPFFTVGQGNKTFSPDFVSEFHNLGAQVGADVFPGRGLVIMHRGTARNPVIFAMSPLYSVVVLALLLMLAWAVVRLLTRRRVRARRAALSGGLKRITPEMTYSATGFSNPVRVVFNTVLRPVSVRENRETIAQHFLSAIRKDRREIHFVDRILAGPIVRGVRSLALQLARMHSGRVNTYAAYVLITLLAIFLIRAVL